jgi:hypothetical protein
MSEWLGWTATALFTTSYFCRRPSQLRRVQMAAALLWVVYGALMHAVPVVAANVLVIAAAAIAGQRGRTADEVSVGGDPFELHAVASPHRGAGEP